MAIKRRMHGAPGPWSSARDEHEPATEPRHLPYRPHYRHHLWFVDMRYLVKIAGHWVYSLCLLEGYSRPILAGMASEHQELPALLQLLFAALSTSGCPEGIVSDHGAVFQAHAYVAILQALEIEPKYIKLAPFRRTFLVHHMPGSPPTSPSKQSGQRELSHGLCPIPVRSSVWWDTSAGTITPALDLMQFIIDHAVTRVPHLP